MTVVSAPGLSARGTRPEDVAIDVRDLRMRYGTVDVLKGVEFSAGRGEVLTLLGPNGAGKTTIIEILEGFRMRSAGDVRVLGLDPAKGDEAWRARVGVVLQSWRDHGKWRVHELLRHMGKYYTPYSTSDRPRPQDVDELMETVGLTEHAGKRISTLSGGQRRRLDVAIGIVGRPELLFLDEPTAGFDPEARRDFHDLVHSLALIVALAGVPGVGGQLAIEREDTTLLRTRALPYGVVGLFSGRLVTVLLDSLVTALLVLGCGWLVVDGMRGLGPVDVPTLLWLVPLGLVATASVGAVVGRRDTPVERPQRVSAVVRAARADLYGNTLNETVFARPGIWLSRALVYVDNRGVDGLVNGLAAMLGGGSGRLRRLQTGFVRSYALSMLIGGFLLVGALLMVRFG